MGYPKIKLTYRHLKYIKIKKKKHLEYSDYDQVVWYMFKGYAIIKLSCIIQHITECPIFKFTNRFIFNNNNPIKKYKFFMKILLV